MSKPVMVSHPEFGELDLEKFRVNLGDLMMTLPRLSEHVGHENLAGVVQNYFHPEVCETKERQAAAAFIKDYMAGKTAPLLKRWDCILPLLEKK